MEAEREDGRQNMHCLEKDLDEKRKKLDETVAYIRCDACHQIAEMEDRVYSKFEKVEETRRAIQRQAA